MGPDSLHALTKLELLVRVALSAPKNAGEKTYPLLGAAKGSERRKIKKKRTVEHGMQDAARTTFKDPFDILSLWSLQVSGAYS